MFLPIRDENPTERVPFVNYGLITLNIIAFLYTWPSISAGQWWLLPGYGLVPSRISADPSGEAFTILTSMFMHGGWAHLGSNMLFLHIFGDNLEDSMGHVRYLCFYLLCGLVAALTQVAVDVGSPVPMVGASGAIAGVVAGYLLLFPRAPIVTLVFFFFVVMPAWAISGMFIVVNVLQALEEFGHPSTGGVAVVAHVGGIVAGFALTRPFLLAKPVAVLESGRRQWTGFQRAPGAVPPAAATGGGARWRRRPRPRSD
jgi:membrane associated rhomboid family serine protease